MTYEKKHTQLPTTNLRLLKEETCFVGTQERRNFSGYMASKSTAGTGSTSNEPPRGEEPEQPVRRLQKIKQEVPQDDLALEKEHQEGVASPSQSPNRDKKTQNR